MMKRIAMVLGIAAAALAAGASAQVQTLYKLIHPNGKVEYAEKPPKDFPGKVVRIDVNPDANTATLPKYEPPAPGASGAAEGRKGSVDKAKQENRIQAAREKLEDARKALKDAQDNPGEADVTRVGNAGGGTRPVFSDAYQEKLKRLEQAVKDASDDLRVAEGKQ